MDIFYKYRYYHNFNYEPLELNYTYNYNKFNYINKNEYVLPRIDSSISGNLLSFRERNDEYIIENCKLTFTFPEHITPLLGIHYYLNLPNYHPLKLNIEDIELKDNKIEQRLEEVKQNINQFVHNIEDYTLEDINDFFSIFNKDRLIDNIEKFLYNYIKYKKLFNLLGFNYNSNIHIEDYIKLDNYSNYKDLFINLQNKETEYFLMSSYIKYLFGIPYSEVYKDSKKKHSSYIYIELFKVLNRIDIYEFIINNIKSEFNFYKYITIYRSAALKINLRINHQKYLSEKIDNYNLNKYTYENPNSGLEDPIFIKYVDDFIKHYKRKKNSVNKTPTTQSVHIIFNLEFANYLTFKEYKYLKDNGIQFDFDDSNF